MDLRFISFTPSKKARRPTPCRWETSSPHGAAPPLRATDEPATRHAGQKNLGAERIAPADRGGGGKLHFDDALRDADGEPYREGFLAQLAEMGGADAVRILDAYVRDDRVTRGEHLIAALNSLARLDRARCGDAARFLRDQPRAAALSEEQAARLRIFAGFGEK